MNIVFVPLSRCVFHAREKGKKQHRAVASEPNQLVGFRFRYCKDDTNSSLVRTP